MFDSTIPGMLAGLAVFFVGAWILRDNLERLSAQGLRRPHLPFKRHPWLGFSCGCLAGATAQSLTAVVCVLARRIAVGQLTLCAAIPVLVGANIGSAALVYLATIDVDLAVLVVMGLSGLLMARADRIWPHPIPVGLFGLGLLFLGIDVVLSNATPWRDFIGLEGHPTTSFGGYSLAFGLGVVVCLAAQSMVAATVLILSLGGVGVLTFDLAILAVLGANLGSGLATGRLAARIFGSPRQIVFLQIILSNTLSTSLFLALFIVETVFDLPLLKASLLWLSDDLAGQLTCLFLALCVPLVPALVFAQRMEGLLARVAPATRGEHDSRPEFIQDTDIQDIQAALIAAERDQTRLLIYLGRFFDTVDRSRTDHTEQSLVAAFGLLATEIDDYLHDLAGQAMSPETCDHLNRLLYRQSILRALANLACDCVPLLRSDTGSAGMVRFVRLMRTGLETTLATFQSAHVDGSARDQARLAMMVGDRSKTFAQLRYAYLTKHGVTDTDERMSLVRLSVTAERMFRVLDLLSKTWRDRPGAR